MKEELLELLPDLRIVDVLGSSETGRQGVQTSDRARGACHRHLRALPHQRRAVRGPRPPCSSRATAELGWLAQTGRVPRGYLGDPEKTRPHLPRGGRRAPRRRRRPGPGARRRLGGAPRPRLRHHQHRRREGVRRGGRAGHQAPSRRVRRGRGRAPQRAVGPGGRRRRAAPRRPRARRRRPAGDRRPSTSPATSCPKAVVRVPVVERSPSGKPDYRWAARASPRPRERRRSSGSGGGCPAFDSLRAIAVPRVLVTHVWAVFPFGPFGFERWTKSGFLGVDLFFVLSGFLITSLLAAGAPTSAARSASGQLLRSPGACACMPALPVLLRGVPHVLRHRGVAAVRTARLRLRNSSRRRSSTT